jgi:hypothetical protein
MALQPFVGPCPLLQFRNLLTQTVELLGRLISPLQGRYLHAGQHKHRMNARTNIHALNRIRNHDPSVRASKDSSCPRRRSHYDRLTHNLVNIYFNIVLSSKPRFPNSSLPNKISFMYCSLHKYPPLRPTMS